MLLVASFHALTCKCIKDPFFALLPLAQVQPDFIPWASSGSGGDTFQRLPSISILAAATTAPHHSQIDSQTKPLAGGSARGYPSASGVQKASNTSSTSGGAGNPASGKALSAEGIAMQHSENPSDSSYRPSGTDRLWRRFTVVTLDSPTTPELRTVFSRACNDAFGGEGPVFSAMSGAPRTNARLFSGEV